MQLLNHINTQSNGSLTLERVENIGGHYVKTLRLWREKFLLNFHDKIRPALLNSNPDISKDAIEVFRKKWEVRIVIFIRVSSSWSLLTFSYKYYFSYCEAGFSTKVLDDVIITVGREAVVEFMEDIPR